MAKQVARAVQSKAEGSCNKMSCGAPIDSGLAVMSADWTVPDEFNSRSAVLCSVHFLIVVG